MTFSEIWNKLCDKHPALLINGKVHEIKSENLKSLLKQVYEKGQKSTDIEIPESISQEPSIMKKFEKLMNRIRNL